MKEDLFKYFTTDNISGKKCTEKWLFKNNYKLYNMIINWCNENNLEKIEFKRKVYHYINDTTEIPLCIVCKDSVKYKRLKDGYQSYCSQKCQYLCEISKDNWLKSWKNNNSNNEHIVNRNKTILEKYGDSNSYKKIINNKKVENSLKKYGVEYVMQTELYKENRKKSLNEKYGSDTYNNPNKTRETRINNGTQINDEIINSFIEYKKCANNITLTIYRNNKKYINPNNLKRGIKSYHLDHKYSIKQGFLNNLPIEIITHPCNLHLIEHKENLKKQDNCWITKEELLYNIILYENEIIFKQNHLKDKYSNIKELAKLLLQ